MKRAQEEIIDFLLGELEPGREEEVSRRIASDPEAAGERDLYVRALGVIRAAAAEGWESRRSRLRFLRPALAAAALLLVTLSLFFLDGSAPTGRVFEPKDVAFGCLLPEETDSHGHVLWPAEGDGYVVRLGTVDVAALESTECYELKAGEPIRVDSEIRSSAEGARIDMPRGGILFLAPLSTVQIRRRDDGRAAVRLVGGEACSVADGDPVHLAVETTDLLLTQESGAAFLRFQEPEVVCLRGDLYLNRVQGARFRVPAGELLPAACADAPQTVPSSVEELGLDWYRDLVFDEWTWEELTWMGDSLVQEVDAGPESYLFVRVVPGRKGRLEVRFGGEARDFPLYKGMPFEARLKLADLGPGPVLEVESEGLRAVRVFSAKPRS